MRILYFSLDYTTHDRRFLAKIAEAGHEVLFLQLHDDGIAYETRPLPPGVRAVRWAGIAGTVTPEGCLAHMPQFTELLATLKPDLVHAGPIPTCTFMVALAGFHPLLAMSWGSDILVEAHQDALRGWTTRFALSRADAFVVDCDAVREEIRAITSADASRFVQFPWGLDLERFPRRIARAARGDEITVLCTRSWSEIYGILTAIDAFALAHREDSRLRLVLVGDGPLATQVRNAIDSHGLASVVRLPGRIPEQELGEYFANADVYLSCALSDGTSISLLEAMANGLPIVATDAPGNREWITHQRGGWLASGGDAAGFARGLMSAARLDADSRAVLASQNRAVIEERADWNVNAARLLAAFERFGRPQSPSA